MKRQSYFSRLHRWKTFVSGLEPGHLDFKDRGTNYHGNIMTCGIEIELLDEIVGISLAVFIFIDKLPSWKYFKLYYLNPYDFFTPTNRFLNVLIHFI